MEHPSPALLLLSFCLSTSVAGGLGCLDPDDPGNLVPGTVDDDPSLPRVALNGTVFHAETVGPDDGPVIVMLHRGPGADYRGMTRLRQPVDGLRLEDRYRIVFWDQRGSGLSRRHAADEITNAVYDADLLAIVDHYAPNRKVVLVGHSWGAMYATSFIGQHPERVAGAVLMDSGPLTAEIFDAIKGEITSLDFGSEWLNDTAWGQSIVTPDGHARADYIRMLGDFGDSSPGYHSSKTDRIGVWRHGAVANKRVMRDGIDNGWRLTAGIDRYTTTVLFMGGELNIVSGAELQERQRKLYPSTKLSVISGSGHDYPWTHPQETLRPIVAYLSEIGF